MSSLFCLLRPMVGHQILTLSMLVRVQWETQCNNKLQFRLTHSVMGTRVPLEDKFQVRILVGQQMIEQLGP